MPQIISASGNLRKLFFDTHASNNGKVMNFPGGVPLKIGNEVVGAVGVSGGVDKQNQAVSEAAASAFESRAKKHAA